MMPHLREEGFLMPVLRPTLFPDAFPSKHIVRQFEGGTIYTAERDGKLYVIEDEGALLGMLNEEDRAGLEFVRIHEFATESDRQRYLRQRGWRPAHE
jgi:hypothetical protein